MEQSTDILILLPLLNEATTIQKTLDSITNQTYANFIVFAQDNASSDETFEVVMRNAFRDSRIKVNKKVSRLGMSENWIDLYKQATSKYKAKYICWMGGDDIWLENTYLENLVHSLIKFDAKVVVPAFRTTIDFIELSDPYPFHLNKESRFGRVRALTNNWHEVHALFGVYDQGLFEKILKGHFGMGAPSNYGDWWWVFDLIQESKVEFVQNSTYIKRHWGRERWRLDVAEGSKESRCSVIRLFQRLRLVQSTNSYLFFEGRIRMICRNPILLVPFFKYQCSYFQGCSNVFKTMLRQAFFRYFKT